jgi:hypothetical protein
MENTDKSLLGMIFGTEDKAEADVGACPMPSGAFPQEMPPAMAYVPYQQWQKPYDPEAALDRGTIFPCLDKPFIGEEAVKNGR